MKVSGILDLALGTRLPVLLWGPPGVGKSAAIRAWADRRKIKSWVIIASLREPSDFGGLPVLAHLADSGNGVESRHGGRSDNSGSSVTHVAAPAVSFAPPAFAVEASIRGGVIFLDELTTAPPAVQAALLRAVMDCAFGDLQLNPDKVAIFAAANPPEYAPGGWDLAPPLANRFLHYDYPLNATEWIQDFPGYWGCPPRISFGGKVLSESAWSNSRSLIAAFIRARPALLLDMPGESDKRGRAWPSPRTWDYFSRVLAFAGTNTMNRRDARLELGAACVGPASAGEFVAWGEGFELPDPESLLSKPSSYRHPRRGDRAYAVLSAVVQAAVGELTPERWLSAWAILAKAAERGAPDVAAVPARVLARRWSRTSGLPVPDEYLQPFTALLEAAGLIEIPSVRGNGKDEEPPSEKRRSSNAA